MRKRTETMLMVRIARSISRRRSRWEWASSLVIGAPPRPKMSPEMAEAVDLAHRILFGTGNIQEHRINGVAYLIAWDNSGSEVANR